MRRLVYIVIILVSSGTGNLAMAQSEILKGVVNNLAFYHQQKELRYLTGAKKSVDSLIRTKADSADLEKNVFKVVIYSAILYADSLNRSGQPADLLTQTAELTDRLALREHIYRYRAEMDFVTNCLANSYIRSGFRKVRSADYSSALSAFKKARRYAPFSAVHSYLAYTNMMAGNTAEAAKEYDLLVKTDSLTAGDISSAALVYQTLGDTSHAIQLLKRGRRLFQGNKILISALANIYSNRKDYDALSALMPQLLDDNPNNADIAFVAANCFDNLGQTGKAELLYLKSIELNNNAFAPVFNLGLIYLKSSANEERAGYHENLLLAVKWLKKASEIAPDNLECLSLLKLANSRQGYDDEQNKINLQIKQLTN